MKRAAVESIRRSSHFYGDLMQRRVAGPFLITESMFPGGSTLPAHAHDSAYFTLTLKGSYREQFGSHWRVCAPGSLVAHPAHELHSQIFDRQSALLVRLAFADDASERAVREFVPERPLALTSASVARAAWQLHQEMSLAEGFSQSNVEALAYELVGYATRGTRLLSGSRARARRAEALLREALRLDRPASVVARELGVSRATFFRDFQSEFACTPGQYLRERRINAAAELLRRTRRPLAEIASICGFYDQSHFNRCFRKAVGLSPDAFRRAAR
jgi:AraC family transcriptional regulator